LNQGTRHIRSNHSVCNCLDSKPSSTAEYAELCALHQVAGIANSSTKPNALLIDVGFDTILEAAKDMVKGTEVFPKYAL
jgi:hypothetical protein